MHGNDPSESEHRKAKKYLEHADHIHGFELANGVYRPESADTNPEKQDSAAQNKYAVPHPVRVDVGPDWPIRIIDIFGLGVSAFTAILLMGTIFIAHQQWVESHRTADASIVQAQISQEALREAKESGRESSRQSAKSLKATIDNFHDEQRPWLSFQNIQIASNQFTPELPPPTQEDWRYRVTHPPQPGLKIDGASAVLVNTGRTPAHILKFVTVATTRVLEAQDSLPTPDEVLTETGAQQPFIPRAVSPGQATPFPLSSVPHIEIAPEFPKRPLFMVIAEAVYTDTTKRIYHTTLCVYVDNLHPNQMSYCPFPNSNLMD
jgi:hypothetical protein